MEASPVLDSGSNAGMTAVPTRYVCGTTLVHHRGNGTAAVQPESTCATPHFHHRRRDVRAPGAAATVEVSPCVFLDGDPYERLTTMAKQARANEAQFLEHLILRAEAIYNFQPPLPPPPRPWWKLWGKDPEIELPAIVADLRNIA